MGEIYTKVIAWKSCRLVIRKRGYDFAILQCWEKYGGKSDTDKRPDYYMSGAPVWISRGFQAFKTNWNIFYLMAIPVIPTPHPYQ